MYLLQQLYHLTLPCFQGARRGVNSLEMLTLEQIRMLSDSALINMFADSTSDELRRQFTYTCFLMPEHCQESFSSFGNESRARQRVKAHLLAHIGELLQDSNSKYLGGRFTKYVPYIVRAWNFPC